ncbi:LysR family transcriptional regulator [Acetobacter conturbans]|uniref:LysR family transcriptional regulator n=1 Tax=Acetobacter conturbans TaxID=1737472 RepID=A0ABX0K3R4_9PROT|nr:LysR family transcriptional regulator [Acetobacter conturbans]NHN89436.1 LysR family transcriptional regulator [Acetobacter conturbans]
MTIEIRHLRSALTAAEHKSFRKASATSGVRAAAISKDIRLLEEVIGCALFTRTRAGVRPTLHGIDFLQVARQIVQDVDMLTNRPGTGPQRTERRLTIGYYTSVSTGNLRATLGDFQRRHPGVPWKFVGGSRASLLQKVETAQIDIAIVTAGGLEWRDALLRLWSERCVAALRADHSLAALPVLEWSLLRHERFLTSTQDPGPEITDIIRQHLSVDVRSPNIVSHDMETQFLKPFVAENGSVMIDYESATGDGLTNIVYRQVLNGRQPAALQFVACWREDNPNPSLARFLHLLRERYPDIS